MQPWVRIDDGTDVTKAGFRTVVHKVFTMNSGEEMHADISDVEGNQASIVFALTPENQVVVARQFRCGPERLLDEMPGGLIDPGETPEEAARRELREETGYEGDQWRYLGFAWVNPWNNTKHHYFVARNCRETTAAHGDGMEEIEVATISIDKLIENAKNASMADVQGVLLAYDELLKIKEETQ